MNSCSDCLLGWEAAHTCSFQVVQTFDIHNLGVFQHGFTDANFSISQKFKMVEEQRLYSLICSTIAPREIYKELKLSFLIFNISQTLSIPAAGVPQHCGLVLQWLMAAGAEGTPAAYTHPKLVPDINVYTLFSQQKRFIIKSSLRNLWVFAVLYVLVCKGSVENVWTVYYRRTDWGKCNSTVDFYTGLLV